MRMKLFYFYLGLNIENNFLIFKREVIFFLAI